MGSICKTADFKQYQVLKNVVLTLFNYILSKLFCNENHNMSATPFNVMIVVEDQCEKRERNWIHGYLKGKNACLNTK